MKIKHALADLANDLKLAQDRFKFLVEFITNLGDVEWASFFFNNLSVKRCTYSEAMEYLHELRKHCPFKLSSYSYSTIADPEDSNNRLDILSVYYRPDIPDNSDASNHLVVCFELTDFEFALEKIGGGKCKLVTKEKPAEAAKTWKTIECSIK